MENKVSYIEKITIYVDVNLMKEVKLQNIFSFRTLHTHWHWSHQWCLGGGGNSKTKEDNVDNNPTSAEETRNVNDSKKEYPHTTPPTNTLRIRIAQKN